MKLGDKVEIKDYRKTEIERNIEGWITRIMYSGKSDKIDPYYVINLNNGFEIVINTNKLEKEESE